MSTRSLVAYKRADQPYVCKCSHYGSLMDYENEYYGNDFDEYVETVLAGDSSEPFDGFYSDFDHCKSLGWDEMTYVKNLKCAYPKIAKTLNELFNIGLNAAVDYIVVKHDDESLHIYEYNGLGNFVECVSDIMPFNIDAFDDFDLDEIKEEMHQAMEQVNELCEDASDIIANYDLQEEQIDSLDREGLKQWMIRFNNAVPELQRRSEHA